MACKRVLYSGNVQGVGFRMTAQRIAGQFAVAGFVRNLPNGGVELIASGDAEEIDRFLGAIAGRMKDYIQDQRVEDHADHDFDRFEIRA